MRSFIFALSSLILLGSCLVSSQVNKPKRSFIGNYKPLTEKNNGTFTTSLSYKGYKATTLKGENVPNELPWIEITFKNPTDSSIVIEFPFNWHKEFIRDTIYFKFNHKVTETYYVELFYPNKKDTANNFIRSPQYVYLNPQESLSIGAFIYNPILENKSKEELTFSLWFRYLPLLKVKKITSEKANEFIQYKTEPITILIK